MTVNTTQNSEERTKILGLRIRRQKLMVCLLVINIFFPAVTATREFSSESVRFGSNSD